MAQADSKSSKTGRATGPRTPQGKAISSGNSTTHGCCSNKLILPGEKQEEYDQLLCAWLDDYQPTTQDAMYLVREASTAQWFLIRNRGRYNDAEHRVCHAQPDAVEWTDEQHKLIERFRRYMTQAERQFSRAFSMLEQLRKNRFVEGMTLQRAEMRAKDLELKRASQAEAAREKAEKAVLREQVQEQKKAAEGLATTGGRIFEAKKNSKKRKKLQCLEQWVEITVQNGQTNTMLYPSNELLKERWGQMSPAPDYVYRRLNFPNGVPAEYEWVGVNENRKQYGGCALQRMTPETWLAVIEREGPEVTRTGYVSSIAPRHIGPSGTGNLPRPKERGECECAVCKQNREPAAQREPEAA